MVNKCFNVVHAWLHSIHHNDFFTDQIIENLHGLDSFPLIQRFSESREWQQYTLPYNLEGLSTTYCGHCIVNSVQRALSHVMIDTGSFKNGLTLVDTSTQETYFQPRI